MNQLRAGPSVTVGSTRITPLERVRIEGAVGGTGICLYACKRPVGLLISTREGLRAVDLEGNPMPLGEALAEIGGLGEEDPRPGG